jgi:hypothetical protein
MLCAFLAMHYPFLATLRLFLAMLCPLLGVQRVFLGASRPRLAMPYPFVAMLCRFLGMLSVFLGASRPRLAMPYPFVAMRSRPPRRGSARYAAGSKRSDALRVGWHLEALASCRPDVHGARPQSFRVGANGRLG